MSPPRQPSEDALADEGMLVVAAALRLALKNRLILRAVADQADFDEGWLFGVLREEIGALVAEKQAENERIAGMIPRAHRRRGSPYAADDYRRRDVPVLELRQRVNEGLVERLRGLAEDEDWMRRQVDEARASALVEIVHPRLDPPAPPLDDRYRSERTDRMKLVAQDLAELASARPAEV